MPRYASIWFPYLLAEYTVRKKPALYEVSFVLASRQRGRMVIDSVSLQSMQKGISPGMVLADCKAIFPELKVIESRLGEAEKLLFALAEWCIGYTPFTMVDLPNGLILDTSGCAHLWGGEAAYLENLKSKLTTYGYSVKIAIADTIGAAWALARFGNQSAIAPVGKQYDALLKLPATALRLEANIVSRFDKLGLQIIGSFIDMPNSVLRRRFGPSVSWRINQALGNEIEMIIPIKPVALFQERISSIEPISTPKGISIALEKLLETLCAKLEKEGLGLRKAIFRTYRIDGDIQKIEIGTVNPSRNATHLFRLFEHKIGTLQPDLGYESFVLEAPKYEPMTIEQGAIWHVSSQSDNKVAELLDRVTAKSGQSNIARYLPSEQHWPERSVKQAVPLWEKPSTFWRNDFPRPTHLLPKPEIIEVSAVLPDYPPMLFRYKDKIYNVVKSDGPERIEQEWWLSDGLYRDYYCIEDEHGARYWLFRSGPYHAGKPQWYIHGFFA